MRSSLPAYQVVRFFCLLIVPSIVLSAGSLHELSDRREELTQQLDSLNLLKQDLKRKGTAITEIELHQARLRDSLNYLRSRIQLTSKNHSPAGNRKSPGFIQMPVTLFDWIIVIVGGVAFFSGLMLVIGISRSFSSRKKRGGKKRKRPPSPQPAAEKTVENKPAPMYPSPVPPSAAPEDSGTISLLQQRIAQSSVLPPDGYRPHPEKNRSKRPEKTSSAKAVPDNTASLEEQVLAAANSGLDAAAISRKFHISVDHAALLLKVSVPPRK